MENHQAAFNGFLIFTPAMKTYFHLISCLLERGHVIKHLFLKSDKIFVCGVFRSITHSW